MIQEGAPFLDCFLFHSKRVCTKIVLCCDFLTPSCFLQVLLSLKCDKRMRQRSLQKMEGRTNRQPSDRPAAHNIRPTPTTFSAGLDGANLPPRPLLPPPSPPPPHRRHARGGRLPASRAIERSLRAGRFTGLQAEEGQDEQGRGEEDPQQERRPTGQRRAHGGEEEDLFLFDFF